MILRLRGLGGAKHGLRALLVKLIVGLADDITSDVLQVLPAFELELCGTDSGTGAGDDRKRSVDGDHDTGCGKRPTGWDGGAIIRHVLGFRLLRRAGPIDLMPMSVAGGSLLTARIEVGDCCDCAGGEGQMIWVFEQRNDSGSHILLVGVADAETAGHEPALHCTGGKRRGKVRDLRHVLAGDCPITGIERGSGSYGSGRGGGCCVRQTGNISGQHWAPSNEPYIGGGRGRRGIVVLRVHESSGEDSHLLRRHWEAARQAGSLRSFTRRVED